MLNKDRFEVGSEVRIVRAAQPLMLGTKAVVVEAKRWRDVQSRQPGANGYQLHAYVIRLADGTCYAAEEHTIDAWPQPSKAGWVANQRRDKVDWKQLAGAIGWAPKNVELR